MKKQLKNYKQLNKKLEQDIADFEDRPANLVIDLCVDNQNIYNKLGSIERARINDELISYLQNEIEYKPTDATITVEIETKNAKDEKFIEHLVKLIKDSTIEDIANLIRELKRNSKVSIILLIAGLSVLIFMSFFQSFIEEYVLSQFLVILSWVLIWQFVEGYFFDRRKLKYQKTKLMQLYFAKFKYKE